MANVLFKKGLSTALPTTGQEGTFYLTTDTRRLYVGTSDNKIVPICETVQIVANVKSLPSSGIIEGQFYYATEENILCIYKNGSWTQINPDTTNTYLNVDFTSAADGKSGQLLIEIEDSKEDTVSDTISISLTNLKMTGSSANDTLVLEGDKNTLETTVNEDTDTATITLKSSLGLGDTSVKVIGDGGIAVKNGSNAGEVIISAEEVVAPETVDLAIGTGGVFRVDLNMDNGNVITGATVTPTIITGTTENKFGTDGKVTLPVYTKTEIDNQFKTKLIGLNAMTYKGTLEASSSKPAAPTANISIGDTYLVTGSGFIKTKATPETLAEPGDLIIARGTEGTDGYITSASLVWDIVPSGDEIDTQYSIIGDPSDTQAFNLVNKKDHDDVAGVVSIKGENLVDVSRTASNNTVSYTVKHGATGTSADTTNNAYNGRISTTHKAVKQTQFTVVDSITRDSYGHVKTINTKTVSLEDTNLNGIGNEISVAADAANNAATVTVTAVGIDANGDAVAAHTEADQNFIVKSSNTGLTVGVDTATDAVVLNYVWGSF